jgi:T-complex protein 1 subunit alpha
VHPTTIISGFKLAAKEACRFMEDWLAVSVDKLGEEAVRNCAGTTLASKMIGAEWKFFAKLAIDAIMTVKQKGINKDIYQIKSINTIKIHGKSIL